VEPHQLEVWGCKCEIDLVQVAGVVDCLEAEFFELIPASLVDLPHHVGVLVIASLHLLLGHDHLAVVEVFKEKLC
jgi:hypothetical protein